MESCSVVRTCPSSGVAFFQAVEQFYRQGLFCDVTIHASNGNGIPCHRLVVASVSRTLGRLLRDQEREETGVVADSDVLVPGIERSSLRAFLDGVYALLAGKTSEGEVLAGSADLTAALDVDLSAVARGPQDNGSPIHPSGTLQSGLKRKSSPTSPIREKRVKKTRRRTKRCNRLIAFKKPPDGGIKEEEQRKTWTKEEAYEMMKKCSGDLGVDVQDEFLDAGSHVRARPPTGTTFQALLGISSGSQGEEGQAAATFRALPLAWNLLRDEDPTSQYRQTCAAFQSVFGFSDMEAFYSTHVYSKQGMARKNNHHKVRYILRKDYMQSGREDLEKVLLREDVVAVTRRTPPKSQFPTGTRRIDLQMSRDVAVEDLEAVVLVTFLEDGPVVGHVMKVAEAARQDDVDNCLKALFEIWSTPKANSGRRCLEMPRAPEMMEMYDRLMNVCEEYRVVQEFLRDADGTKREKLLAKEKQCHECGMVFSLKTSHLDQKFSAHRRMHFYQNFTCDCNVTLTSLAAKTAHVKLCHSGGKFSKCCVCGFVATAEALKKHSERVHERVGTSLSSSSPPPAAAMVCAMCGAISKNHSGYYKHLRTHKVYECSVCGETLVGHEVLLSHRRKFHPEARRTFRCDQCGKDYVSVRKLREHVLRVHTPDSERPYQCADCDRGFARGLELNAHRIMAHVKNRPFQCRYGCGVAYNDASSRGTHERKKHGATFSKAVTKAEMEERRSGEHQALTE